jgi:hypothetical protein
VKVLLQPVPGNGYGGVIVYSACGKLSSNLTGLVGSSSGVGSSGVSSITLRISAFGPQV